MFFFGAANLVRARPPIDFGPVMRFVAPTARRGAGRPGAISFFFLFLFAFAGLAFLLPAFLATFFVPRAGIIERSDEAALWLRFRAPEVLRVEPALLRRVARSTADAVRRTAVASASAIRFAALPPGTPARFAASRVLRPLRLNIVLACAAARFAPVRAALPTRAAASPAALAVDDSVPAARPSTDPTTSAPRSTSVIEASAACASGSPGRVVLLSSAIQNPPNGSLLQTTYQKEKGPP